LGNRKRDLVHLVPVAGQVGHLYPLVMLEAVLEIMLDVTLEACRTSVESITSDFTATSNAARNNDVAALNVACTSLKSDVEAT
jgi:hypothetical protein